MIIITNNSYDYYCRHYPTTKFTAVADTPEQLRLAKQSRQQSQVRSLPIFVHLQNPGKYVKVNYMQEGLSLVHTSTTRKATIPKVLKFLHK